MGMCRSTVKHWKSFVHNEDVHVVNNKNIYKFSK
jgi:hypothetical protein